MQQILSPIATRLQELQIPNLYQLLVSYEMLRVYLIGISNDKPANSLVQNQPEPHALYGCAKCEIAGEFLYSSERPDQLFSSFSPQVIQHQLEFTLHLHHLLI